MTGLQDPADRAPLAGGRPRARQGGLPERCDEPGLTEDNASDRPRPTALQAPRRPFGHEAKNANKNDSGRMIKTLTVGTAAIAGFVTLGAQTAAGIDLNGQQIAHQGNGGGAPACTSCHGEQLQGVAALKTPALAGLSREFILSRLAHYAGPDGHNASMRQVATSLSPEERDMVAAYLSSLPPPTRQANKP
jgi:cytochrome c553